MNIINVILTIIGTFITMYIEVITIKKISGNNDVVFNLKHYLIMIIASIIVSLNIFYNESLALRLGVNFLSLLGIAYYFFKESADKTILYTSIFYIIGTFIELLFFSIILKLNINDFSAYENNIFLKSIFSYIVFFMTYLILTTKVSMKIINKITNKYVNILVIDTIFVLFIVALFIADIRNLNTFAKRVYIGNGILIMIFLFLVIVSTYNYIRVKKEIEKSEILLDFMKKYEITIDEYRMYKHEVLNNLLSLKAVPNKNNKEFNKLLNEMILQYDKKEIGIKNISKLPSGLKGLFYYKLYNLESEKFKIKTNISKNISDVSSLLDYNNYVLLCKTIGIILDNSIEAARVTKEKYIGIDIYENENYYIIDIDNSTNKNFDISKINNKNYSTKGNGKGLGLFILNNMLKNNNLIDVNQNINNDYFLSEIKIKK